LTKTKSKYFQLQKVVINVPHLVRVLLEKFLEKWVISSQN